MNKYYIYKIINDYDQKVYIGKCTTPHKRWISHKASARRPEDKKRYLPLLYNAMNKHTIDNNYSNFKLVVIAEYDDESFCLNEEIRFIEEYNSRDKRFGYNLNKGGDGNSGFRFTEEQKTKLNQDKKETYLGEGNPFYGKQHTPETKNLIGQKAIERNYNGERNPFYGKEHSEDTRALMRKPRKSSERKITNEEAELMRADIYNNKYGKTREENYKYFSKIFGLTSSSIKKIFLKSGSYKKERTGIIKKI